MKVIELNLIIINIVTEKKFISTFKIRKCKMNNSVRVKNSSISNFPCQILLRKSNLRRSNKLSKRYKNMISDGHIKNYKIIKEINRNNTYLDDFFENYQNIIYEKIDSKIENILNFFEKVNVRFDDLKNEENPIFLLKQLLKINNINERKDIIDNIDMIVSNLL